MQAVPHDDLRLTMLEAWLSRVLGRPPEQVAPASADASFRRYFRAWVDGVSYVAMDAPPGREDLGPFLRVAALLAGAGVNVPQVFAQDPEQGFLLLSDLGSTQMLAALRAGADPDRLYAEALGMLVRLQCVTAPAARVLPCYDSLQLQREMSLFPEWFIARHLGLELTAAESHVVSAACAALERAALAQPRVLVHRDYHSRNLMVCATDSPGVLDFQDAVFGPVTYDLVSLLKDCYIRWPRQRILGWLDAYRAAAGGAGVDVGRDRAAFVRDFDLMGLQRHLKVLGIFARLWYRDGKPGYLRDLPLVVDYVLEVTGAFPALAEFDRLLRQRLVPAFEAAQSRELATT
jgi:N-acetylmuramate 1-kinase